MTPSKKRRERYIRLAGANSMADIAKYEAGCQTQPGNLDARVDELAATLKATNLDVKAKMDKQNEKMDKQNEKLDHVIEALSKLSMARGAVDKPADLEDKSARPEAPEEEEDDLDRIYCSKCVRLCYACVCDASALETAKCLDCDECGFQKPMVRLTTGDLELMLKSNAAPDAHTINEKCPQCHRKELLVSLNILECERVCEQCLGIHDQDTISPCCAELCEVDGFFHEQCMRKYANFDVGGGDTEDLFICVQCDSLGKLPFVDESEGSGSDDSETDYRSVKSHRGLSVGMPLRGGTVSEIFPGLDKFTVSSSSGGVNTIQHLLLSEYERRSPF
jgi:hypothetical protein